MGDREKVRQQLDALDNGFYLFGLQGLLESVFPYICSLSELPTRVNDKKVDTIAFLYPAIGVQEQEETRKALLYLYPFLKHVPIDAFKKPTYRQSVIYLAFWATLASEECRSVIDSLVSLDLTRLDKAYLSRFGELPQDESARANMVENVLMMLRQAWERVDQVKRSEPVKILKSTEIAMIAEQRLKPNYEKPYFEEANGFLICIDPLNDIETILTRVEAIIKEEHERIAKDHESNWSESERELYGEFSIMSEHPKHEFEFDRSYHSSYPYFDNIAKEQTFLDRAFRALLYHELTQKGLSGPEIGKKFFGKDWKASTDPNYQIAKTDASKNKKFAKMLIGRALSGWPL